MTKLWVYKLNKVVCAEYEAQPRLTNFIDKYMVFQYPYR